jgi:O-antigen ligase
VKYRKLLLLPLCVVLFHEQVWRNWALRSYLSVACVLLCLSALLAVAHLAGFSAPDYSSIRPLEPLTGQSYLTLAATLLPASFAGFVLITGNRVLRWRLLGGLILLLGLVYVVWLQSGRTSYWVAMSLMMLAMLQIFRDRRLSLQQSLFGLSLLAVTLVLFWWLSPQLQDRVMQAYAEWQGFTLAQSPDTSIGYRVDFWLASISIIQQVPLIGLGPGEWPQTYASWQASVRPSSDVIASGNPHNEYLLLGSELGLLGPMLLLLLLLGSAWQGWKGRLGSLAENQAVLVVSVTFLAGCMFNSWLFDQNPGHFMALSLGILMAGLNTRHTHR